MKKILLLLSILLIGFVMPGDIDFPILEVINPNGDFQLSWWLNNTLGLFSDDGILNTNATYLEGRFNSSSWERLGTEVIIAHPGDDVNVNGTFFINSTSGNVGIGTTTPRAKLEVDGYLVPGTSGLYSLGASTTQADPFSSSWKNLFLATGGIIKIGNNNIIEETDSSLRITGLNAKGIQIKGQMRPRTDSLYNIGTTTLYFKDTYTDRLFAKDNIGIGTTNPQNELEVLGVANASAFKLGDGQKIFFGNADDVSIQFDGTSTNFTNEVGINNWIFSTGNMSIGSNVANEKLEISSAGADDDLALRLSLNPESANKYWDIKVKGAFTGASDAGLAFNSHTRDNNIFIRTTGAVGVGKATPLRALDVLGRIALSSTGNSPLSVDFYDGTTTGNEVGNFFFANANGNYMSDAKAGDTGFRAMGGNFLLGAGPSVATEPDTAMIITTGGDIGFGGILAPTHKVNVLGSANITGNMTTNQFYGEMHFHNDTDGNVTALTEDVWANVTAFGQDYRGTFLNGFTQIDNIALQTKVAGRYKVAYSISFSGTANNKYHFVAANNSNPALQTETHTRVSNVLDVTSATGTGFIDLNIDDIVTLMALNEDSGGDATVFSANINLLRIGN